MKKLLVLYLILIPFVILAQKNNAQLYQQSLIKADIDSLIFKLKESHPTFAEYYQQNNIQSKIDSIKNSLNDSLSSLELFRIMQPVITIDGHTTLMYTGNISADIGNPLFPFKIVIYNNLMYVKENLSDNENISKGSIIEEINGVPINTIIKNLVRYLPGEKKSYKTKSLEKSFHVYYALVYGPHSEFDIIVNGNNYNVKGAKWSEFKEPPRPPFELKFINDDIAYIYKRKFKPPKEFIQFIDSAFNVINEKGVKYLIIDNLRGGGITDLADSLMSYFASNPYCMFTKKMTKVSPLSIDLIEEEKSEGDFQGNYFIREFGTHKPRNNRFTGTTYILTGPLSYSASTCFPAAAKYYHNAIIVGEETGQPLLSNGGLNRFSLPNTKLFCFTSLSVLHMPGDKIDDVNGLVPDYTVIPSLKNLLTDKEYALEYTLKLIRENKNDQ